MSEAAPGLPDKAEFARPERAKVAESIRLLMDAVMTTEQADPGELEEIATGIEQLAFRLAGESREGPGYRPRSHADHLPRSPVVGEASPLSPRLEWEVDGDRVRAHGIYTAVYEGPPGYVHGGIIALAFDEILGITNAELGHPGMTGTLTVKYRRPTPLFREVRLEAWIERVEGRRIVTRGELRCGDDLCAEAEGLFVKLRPEIIEAYFGAGRDQR